MIAQIKKDEKLVAEILVVGPKVSTKIVVNVPRLESYIRYLLDSKFLIGDPSGIVGMELGKIGELGDRESFSMLSIFGNTTEFSIKILNAPNMSIPDSEEGVVI
jgi:nitric oxide synthase oxygenase domain/subunit